MTAPGRDEIADSVSRALAEDLGSGDISAALIAHANRRTEATVVVRDETILCGREWFDEVYRQLDPGIGVAWQHKDGDLLSAGSEVCSVTGPVNVILTGERTALNFLQTLSGTAMAARRYVDAVAGTGARILDTRKTIPGLRRAQKYAVKCAGAENHRMGLFDAYLIKENHIEALGSLSNAVSRASARATGLLIEVEVENLVQLKEALGTHAERLLLDNFSLEETREAVRLRNERAPDKALEASGNITLENVRAIAETGVDWISVGAITKNVQAADYSLRIG